MLKITTELSYFIQHANQQESKSLEHFKRNSKIYLVTNQENEFT